MTWAAVNAAGDVVAVARRRADLVVPTGGQVVDAGHPVAVGYTYDAASSTFTGRSTALRPGRQLLAELPLRVRDQIEAIRFSTFAASSLNSIRIYIDHLASTANCVLIPANRTDRAIVDVLRTELELPPNEWILRQSGFTASIDTSTYYRTAIPDPDDGSGNWTRTSTTFAVEPRTYTTRAAFTRAYLL